MRKWYKYLLSEDGDVELPIDKDFQEHAKAMDGYTAEKGYASKEDFFNTYFHNYHMGRLVFYDDFLQRLLAKNEEILSVGSGRCANELFLIDKGFKITCSDLEPVCLKETKALFPDFNTMPLFL